VSKSGQNGISPTLNSQYRGLDRLFSLHVKGITDSVETGVTQYLIPEAFIPGEELVGIYAVSPRESKAAISPKKTQSICL
jgi:hypothetical protein